MTLARLDKFPAPYYGGKAAAAEAVWAALGDPAHYVEPFGGSLAVLLRRPHPANRTYYSETVNDADGLLVNALRSLAYSPQQTAEAASWPVAEADLMARHLAIVRWRSERDLERLMADPRYHDPEIGGWWLWGVSCWIGSGFASGDGPWVVGDDGRITKRAGGGGVNRQRPHLANNGQGVNHAGAREAGVAGGVAGDAEWQALAAADYEATGGYHPMTMPEVRRWFAWLSARLRHVRILNGDWTRAVTGGALQSLPVRQGDGVAGVFLDPPYGDVRAGGLYTHDSLTVAADVRRWCLTNGDNPRYRIVLAGFAGEGHEELEQRGWRSVAWFADGWLRGGMGNQSANGHQQHRERLWLSPHALGLSALPMEALWQ